MDKEELLMEIRDAILRSGMEEVEKNLILKYFDVKYKKHFQECSDEILYIISIIINQLSRSNSKHEIFINNMITMCLGEHEYNENWENLLKIYNDLPNQIVSSTRRQNYSVKNNIGESMDLSKQFNQLSLYEKKELIKIKKGEMKNAA